VQAECSDSNLDFIEKSLKTANEPSEHNIAFEFQDEKVLRSAALTPNMTPIISQLPKISSKTPNISQNKLKTALKSPIGFAVSNISQKY
jgi:hypothetical protein